MAAAAAANITLPEDDKKASRALLGPFWTRERITSLLRLLVVKFMPLNNEDLSGMAEVPEEFMIAEEASLFSTSLRVRSVHAGLNMTSVSETVDSHYNRICWCNPPRAM